MDKGKRILLVAPHGNIPAYWFPLALGYLKSNVKPHHEVRLLDCTLEEMPADTLAFKGQLEEFKPDVVGVSTASLTSMEALNVLRVAKALDPNVVTVIGGSHPTSYPDAVMRNEFVDFLFRGEADLSFDVFLDQLEGDRNFAVVNGLVYRGRGGFLQKNELENETDIDKIKLPDYHALRLNEYIDRGYNYGGFYGRTAPIWVTRGCPFKCTFCSAPIINGKKIRAHSVDYIVKWVEHLYYDFNIRQFSIIDDNFTFDMKFAKEFCREIIKLRENGWLKEPVHFATPNGVRMQLLDEELCVLMKRAGWQGITIAPESGSLKTLKRMKKSLKPEIVPGRVDMIRKSGLSVRAFFMVGYPDETPEDVKDTVKLIRKCKLDSLIIGRFVPLPGTPIYDELVQLGEIPPDYVPPQTFALFLPFQKELRKKMYNPPGFENFNLFWMLLREHILLAFRNPKAILYFVKYYGVSNVIKKLFFLGAKSGEKYGSAYSHSRNEIGHAG